MSTQQPTSKPLSIIGQSTGISIALVATIIGGIVANVSMMFALRSDLKLIERDVSHIAEDVKEFSGGVRILADETHREMRKLSEHVAALQASHASLQARYDELSNRIRQIDK